MAFQLVVNGIGKVKTFLAQVRLKAKDFRPVYKTIRDDFFRVERDQFSTQGSRGPGSAWKPLNPSYAARKAKVAPGRGILVLSGDMRRSLVSLGGTGAIDDIKRQSMRMGSTNKFAQWHQVGAGNLPERKVVDLKPQDKTRWVKMIQVHIANIIKFARR
jgi:phage gpG-like protein